MKKAKYRSYDNLPCSSILDVRPILEEAHQRKIQNLKLETARRNCSKNAMQ